MTARSTPGDRPASPSRRGRPKRSASSNGTAPAVPAKSSPRKRRSGRPHSATSQPTSRNAYQDTRLWLLEQHGPVCAYCALRQDPVTITLDHVTPRRGQSAYDRRDNLVLACKRCNGLKADTPILAFLIARRERAESLLRYGMHLSHGLLDLARQIAGPEAAARAERMSDPDYPYAD
jgi:5-methylcytosine-specific restriction endonuclease McrA